MIDAATYFPFAILFALGLLRCMRVYSRTGLKAELVKAVGISIMILSFSTGSILLMIIGIVVFNVGFMIAVTYENAFRKDLFSQITLKQKLLGDVPRLRYSKDIRTTYKHNRAISLITASCCFLIAFISYRGLTKHAITDLMYPGLLLIGGVFFLLFSVFKKESK